MRGWVMEFSFSVASGAAKAWRASSARLRVPSALSTPSKASASSARAGSLGSTISRAILSASTIRAPRVFSRLATVDFPEPMPPVSPMRNIASILRAQEQTIGCLQALCPRDGHVGVVHAQLVSRVTITFGHGLLPLLSNLVRLGLELLAVLRVEHQGSARARCGPLDVWEWLGFLSLCRRCPAAETCRESESCSQRNGGAFPKKIHAPKATSLEDPRCD